MARHIHEQTEVGLICLLTEGKPAGSSVTFIVLHDNVKAAELAGAVVGDVGARAGKAATVKYTPPPVADDKTHYVISYRALADGETYLGGDEIHVWPRKGKLNSRNEADSKPLPNFLFKVVQNGTSSTDNFKAEAASVGGAAQTEFRLAAGAPFALVGVAPYEIVGDPEPQGGKLRDLKSKNKINFTSEFVSPAKPADGQIKQWVNLIPDPAKKGCDGLGAEVEVTVGVQGDRSPTGVSIPTPLGQAGMYVYIKLKFSGPDARKSLRNSPKTELLAGLNLIDRVAVKEAVTDTQWEFTGRVELAEAGGVGKFKLQLGLAGGDSCEISIGSTATCGDASLTFTNWRKIWYELMAPDVMALEDGSAEDGTAVRDFPAALRRSMKTYGDPTFVEYAIHRSQSFSEDEALATCPGSVLRREFFQRSSGPAKCYVLTDYTFTLYPKTFDRAKGGRATLIKACDVNLFNDGPSSSDGADIAQSIGGFTTAQADYDLAANHRGIVWSPNSAFKRGAAAASVRKLEWWAEIVDPDVYKGPADLLFEPDVDDPAIDGTSKDRHFHLAELNQNPGRCDLLFKKPALGHTATELDASAKRNIRTWLTGLWGDAQVRPHGFALKIRITGSKGVAADARRAARFLAIRNFIQLEMSSNAPELYKHPGLNPDGTVKEGSLVVADVVDMSRSHWRLLAVNLPALNPDDPGRLAGPEDAQHCPISVYYEFEPQSVGLGMAGQGAQTGEMVLDLDPAAPKCVADTALHELGHQFGLSNIGHALPGIPAPKSIVSNETLARYRDLGVKGNYYTGMGHSGGHCAWGLNDADKANADPPGFTRRRGKCIMFGAMGRDDSRSTMTGFCPQCADRARAQDLNRLL